MKTRRQRIVELAQAMIPNATIAARLNIRARTVREILSRERAKGAIIPLNGARQAHEAAIGGLRLPPLSQSEIARLERAAEKRGTTATDLLGRVARELVASPALLDNVLDDGVTTDG